MTRIMLKEGLDVRDARLETLRRLFSEMQRYTVETCGTDDLLEFVGSTAYFATIEDSESKLLYSSYQLEPKSLDTRSTSEDEEKKVYYSKEHEKLFSTFERGENTASDSGSDGIPVEKPYRSARNPEQKLSVPSAGITVQQKTGGAPDDSDGVSEFTGWDSDDSGWIPSHSEPPISTDAVEDAWAERTPESSPPVAGFLYLLPTYTSPFLDIPAELSVGIILDTPFRRLGFATDALENALKIAFQKLKCHRVQAQVVDSYTKNIALKLFTKMRFGHEGTRRRSFYSPYAQEWKDTTCLGMLAADWASVTPVPSSAWDEMFLRHDRERNSLLRWEDRIVDEQRQLLRSSSTETIRKTDSTKEIKSERTLPTRVDKQHSRKDEAQSTISSNGSSTLVASSYGVERPLSPEFFISDDPEYRTEDEDEDSVDVDSDNELEVACRMLPPLPEVSRPIERSDSSRGDDGYASSSDGSQWDMIERASTSSFDNLSDEEEDREKRVHIL